MKKTNNKNTRSEEAYVGKSGTLAVVLRKHIEIIHDIFIDVLYSDESVVKATAARRKKEINEALEKADKEVSEAINVEKVQFCLVWDTNAFALPCCWDNNFANVNKNGAYAWNYEHELSIHDIIEDTNGYRFKTKDKKIFLIGIGIGLFREGLTVDEVTGIILHEFGHSFQHLLVQAQTNVVCSIKRNLLNMMNVCLDPLNVVLKSVSKLLKFKPDSNIIASYGILWFFSIYYFFQLNSLEKEIIRSGEPETGKKLLLNLIKNNHTEFDRKHMVDEVKTETDRLLDAILNNLALMMNRPIWCKILTFIYKTYVNFINLNFLLITPIFKIISARNIVFYAYNDFYQREKRYEQFADTFATYYGYGAEISSGLGKISKTGIDLGALNLVHLVPGLNVYIAFSTYLSMNEACIMNGYPLTKNRMANNYKVLQFELNNNKSLTPAQKASIQKEMEEIKKVWEKYVFSADLHNLVFAIMSWITRESIENPRDKTIENNVLIPLLRMKEEKKEEYVKNESALSKFNEFFFNKISSLDVSKLKFINFGLTKKGIEGIDYMKMIGINCYIGDEYIDPNKTTFVPGNYKIKKFDCYGLDGESYAHFVPIRKRKE